MIITLPHYPEDVRSGSMWEIDQNTENFHIRKTINLYFENIENIVPLFLKLAKTEKDGVLSVMKQTHKIITNSKGSFLIETKDNKEEMIIFEILKTNDKSK